MVGSATLTIVLSMPTSSTLRHSAASPHQRRAGGAARRCRGAVAGRTTAGTQRSSVSGHRISSVERRTTAIEQRSTMPQRDRKGVSSVGRRDVTSGALPDRQNAAMRSNGSDTAEEAAADRPAGRTPSRDIEIALIDAAERVLVSGGPDAVTVRAVAAEAGVAPMGVYNRFGGKDGLVDAVLIRGFVALREAIAEHGETDPARATARLRCSLPASSRWPIRPTTWRCSTTRCTRRRPHPTSCVTPGRRSTNWSAMCGTRMVGAALAQAEPDEVAQQIWSTRARRRATGDQGHPAGAGRRTDLPRPARAPICRGLQATPPR